MSSPRNESQAPIPGKDKVQYLLHAAFRRILPATGAALSLALSVGAQTKPNFIFVLTDDQRWDMLGAMGLNRIIKTPVMDSLAHQGVLFKNAYVTTSICMASRASVYLGEYQNRTVDSRIVKFGDTLSVDRLKRSVFSVLKANGYFTGWVGKNHLAAGTVDGFDYKETTWKSYSLTEDGKSIHLTAYMGNRALEFLDRVPTGRPFYLNVNTKAPHAEDPNPAGNQFPPDTADRDLYKNDVVPTPPSADPDFYNSLPAFLKGGEHRRRWMLRHDGEPMNQNSIKDYYRLVTGVDRQLGRIMAKLRETGKADNTIIILMGDNGMFLGERGWADKWTAHEHSIRVPLLIHDPRAGSRLKGQMRDEMALNIDVAPTILDLAGLPIPVQMQGRSLVPLLQNRPVPWRSDFYYEHPWTNGDIPVSFGLVESRYKYIEYKGQDYIELYDVIADPYEMNNLAKVPAHRARLDSMIARFKELRTSATEDDEIKEKFRQSVPTSSQPRRIAQAPLLAERVGNTLMISRSRPHASFRLLGLDGAVRHAGRTDSEGRASIHLGTGTESGLLILEAPATMGRPYRGLVSALGI